MTITIREPGSALTHFAGILLAVFAAFPLLLRAAFRGGYTSVISMAAYILSMLLLYLASTVYHSVNVRPGVLRIYRKLDHMMIFILIAGSYTPVCLLVLPPATGRPLLILVWAAAFVGMMMKAFWITCPKWLSSSVYILMGWLCIFHVKDILEAMPHPAFLWLLAGGIIYTIGGVIYALKLPLFPPKKYFGNHELFHLFVLAGSICHFLCMYQCL
ncbi:MAG: hemolysin III family protein [Blautia sp.]|nr:hemolysin III family protein [Blautia sp.]